MKTLTWQKPGQQNVAQELIKIIINYVAELRLIKNSIRGNFGKNFGKVLHLIEFILAYLNLFRCCHATAFIVSM